MKTAWFAEPQCIESGESKGPFTTGGGADVGLRQNIPLL